MPHPAHPQPWRTALRLTRPGFLVVTAVACLLGLALATGMGSGFSAAKATATVLLALIAHAGANVLNDYHDALNGADAANSQGLHPFTGGSRLIQNGDVTIGSAHRFAWALVLMVVPGGLVLASQSGVGLILVGVAGLVIAWAYSAPPLALMSRGLGEPAVAAAWWLVVVGADYVQRGQFAAAPAVAAASFALLVANILLINGVPDAPADAQVGKRTLVVYLGTRRAAWLYLGMALVAHGVLGMAAVQVLPPGALWGLASLPLSLAAAALLWRRAGRPAELRPAIALTIGAAVVHGLSLGAGLAWAARH